MLGLNDLTPALFFSVEIGGNILAACVFYIIISFLSISNYKVSLTSSTFIGSPPSFFLLEILPVIIW